LDQQHVRPVQSSNGDDDKTRERLEWLKSHRDEYGGQYVSLDRDTFGSRWSNLPQRETKGPCRRQTSWLHYQLFMSDEIAQMGGWE
jgi:hypothetical protein